MYTRVQLVLTEDLHRRLREATRRRGGSMSQIGREALERALAEDEVTYLARRRRVLDRPREISEQLAKEAPDLTHTPEDLQAMREERLDAILRSFDRP